jgi:Ca2+-binding EF-hand superfamily protein
MENTKQKNKCLNFSTFAEFILKIDPSCNNDEIKCLFNVFDLNSDGKISQSELQKGICKIAEIVPLEKEDMDEIS